jgi:hypothetical protein
MFEATSDIPQNAAYCDWKLTSKDLQKHQLSVKRRLALRERQFHWLHLPNNQAELYSAGASSNTA